MGIWTLYIEDDTGLDPLGFARFTLDVQVADNNGTPAPEPGTLLLFGAG